MIKKIYSIALFSLSVFTSYSQNMNVTGGNDHALALCREGKIYAWGLNINNRLCLSAPYDTMIVVPSPKLVNTGDLTFTQISAGSGSHSMALASNGTVYCWGDMTNSRNDYSDTNKSIINVTPLPVPCGEAPGYDLEGTPGGNYLGNIKSITATSSACLAILNDGTGRCVIWGDNFFSKYLLEQKTNEPIFIKDENGKPLENIIYMTGGDETVLFIVGDSPNAKMGTLYSIGNLNGRGEEVPTYCAKPVQYGNGNGTKASGVVMTNIRTAGMSDTGGFAVDGISGYVYGWGGNKWWSTCGTNNYIDYAYPEKVGAGEYNKDNFLKDATQVIGGNGYAAILTKEGNILYWGRNDAAKYLTRSVGGVIPNSIYANNVDWTTPVFANYCAGEHGKQEEHRVDDAIAIGRGDLVGFVLNKEGDIYVWGSTGLTGSVKIDSTYISHAGTLGTGNVEEISTCLKKIDLDCKTQDLYPEAYLIENRIICNNEPETLDANFTPIYGTEDNYFYKWTRNGVVLNSSSEKSSLAERQADKFNNSSIQTNGEGIYRVEIIYVGDNIPGRYISDASEVRVDFFDLPITPLSSNEEASAASDSLQFSFVVNDRYYTKKALTNWNIYETEDGVSVYKTLKAEVGDTISFSHLKIGSADATDNSLTLWVEDASSYNDAFYANDDEKTKKPMYVSSSNQYSTSLTTYDDIVLSSYDISLDSEQFDNIIINTNIYEVANSIAGTITLGKLVASADPFIIAPNTNSDLTYTISLGDIHLNGDPVNGKNYCIVMTLKNLISRIVTSPFVKATNSTGNVSIDCTGSGAPGDSRLYITNSSRLIRNIVYKKLANYTCGRFPIVAKCATDSSSETTTTKVTAEDANKLVNVYTTNGTLVQSKVPAFNALDGLRKGIYIVGDKKQLKVQK